MNIIRLIVRASLPLLCLASFLVCALSPLRAAGMRGFGTVTSVNLPDGQGVRFECDSAAHAVLLIQKLANDMAASATVPSRWASVQIAGRAVPVLVRPGLGAYLLLANGATAYCLTAPVGANVDDGALAAQFPSAASLVPDAAVYDPTYTYPAYLDKWSSKGIGTWYTPYDPFDDDPKGLSDIVTPHFEYMKENGLTAHVSDWGPTRREVDRYLQKYQLPYHLQRWMEWDADIARLDPFDLVQPGKVFTGYSDYYTDLSFGGDKLQQYRNWNFQKFVREHVDDPLLTDWDEPHGEIGPASYLYTNDFGPESREHFIKWLQDSRGYTLASLSQAWHGNSHYFTSWDQVPIPYDYEIYGFDKDSVMADRAWRVHTADIDSGIAAGFSRNACDDSQWPTFQLPGGEIGSIMEDANTHFWYRGTLTVSASYLAAHSGKLYLDDTAMTQAGGPNNPDKLWFNGVDLGGMSGPGGWPLLGCKDVTGLVHAGVNHIVYSPVDHSLRGAFFLADAPMQTYPFKDSGLNARYVDWNDYIAGCALEEETKTIQTIRATDPNRPIKVMAAGPRDIFDPMMADYGCFLHNTGDEAFYVPWDRKLGYPYGLRTSAEPSASMIDPKYYNRWFGWFTFEGLNAFDNFIDIEAMMYTPAAPLWKANFPYLHLLNRDTFRKPEIGLLWSTRSGALNTGGKGDTAYVFDMGRGDLQSLGYSLAYFDEPGLHRNLDYGYKVLWDCGTWAMSPQTVADIKSYVEQGGTFVALQETGRYTFTQRDAWPIDSLTGFRVSAIRPMGGFVSILDDQPLFTALRGKNFLNEGRSVDYSGYNFADTCVALEPVAPGTQAIARYRDGRIAIGLRRLGKGRVVVIGSPFWRDSYDKSGMWWPGPSQNTFVKDLLDGLGVPPDVPADSDKVWRDRYVANNGTEEYLVLFNPYESDSQSFSTDWNASFPFTQVFDPKTGQPVPATIQGNTAHLSLTLAPYETKILAVQRSRPPADTVADWFNDLTVTWKASLPGRAATRPDLPDYYVDFPAGAGKLVDAASVTPARLAQLSSRVDAEDGWDPHLDLVRPSFAGIATTTAQSMLYRRVVDLPATWKPGDLYRLRLKCFENFSGVVYLNGKQVATSQETNAARDDGVDVASALNFGGPNVLVIDADRDGFTGSPDIWRQPAPVASVSLSGQWAAQTDEDHAGVAVTLPGDLTALYATKSVQVPSSWRGRHVFLRMDWGWGAPGHLAVNDKVFFFQTDTPKYMDVTPWIKYGAANRILIETSDAVQHWRPGTVTIKSARLESVDHL